MPTYILLDTIKSQLLWLTLTTYVYKAIQTLGRKMAEKLSAVFSAISLGRISKIKQISYMVNGQSLELKNRPYC